MRKIHMYSLASFSGILLSLPWLIRGFGWAIFVAFVPLLIANDFVLKQKRTQALSLTFFLSFLSFLIWNLFSTWWIAYVTVPGMLFVTSLNALFMAGAWWCMNKIHLKLGQASGLFALVVFWIAYEFLSHHGLLPWPWLTLGNGLANNVEIIQWYEYAGVFGGSLWVLIVNVLIFNTIQNSQERLKLTHYKQTALAVVAVLFPVSISLYLYFNYSEKGPIQHVVVVQPNVDPYTEKFNGMSEKQQIERLIGLMELKITDSTDLVLAPETALPLLREDSLDLNDSILNPFQQIVNRFPNLNVVAGAISQRKIERNEVVSSTAQQSVSGEYFNRFNSAIMLNRSGIQFSHKNILVAGVEKEPLGDYFPFLPNFVIDLGGVKGSLAAGKEPKILTGTSGFKIGPVICFESAFGGCVRQLVQNGAQFIAVITNDGWWKGASGVWQHFGYSRVRAIETRRSIIRSANTGISGVINQRGDILAQTSENKSLAINSVLRINDSETFYVRNGDYLGWISLLLSGMAVVYLFIFRRL